MLSFGVYSDLNTGMHSETYNNSSRRLSLCLCEETKRLILDYCTENHGVHQPITSTVSTSVHVTKFHLKNTIFTAKGAEIWKGQRQELKIRHAGKGQFV